MNTTSLLLGLVFSSIGFGYFLYGKKQKVVVPLICGFGLMIFPYFIENITLMSIIGLLLCISPMLFRQ
ncbi:amino acid transport protein [Acinetobacter sp. MD2(2019)]|uniref:amino acid transport protein n=1 Tax=Acinetobacter sp. MD2(2019) TaxID=2605273 RepID=UPI002D1EF04D|nr:amino acid transport protein [Acinetobacter sp. MD2(2019)]MEB3754027.1 amino acid transport protein [Acinetobacter sp. MD2(2019)]